MIYTCQGWNSIFDIRMLRIKNLNIPLWHWLGHKFVASSEVQSTISHSRVTTNFKSLFSSMCFLHPISEFSRSEKFRISVLLWWSYITSHIPWWKLNYKVISITCKSVSFFKRIVAFDFSWLKKWDAICGRISNCFSS